MAQEPNSADKTVVDFTIDALREAIRSGRLAPGQRLVVADITEMLSVSAGPVREAIRRLTGEGLVEIMPHRGASVRRITIEDVAEIFELRTAVEGLAARLAAERGAALHGDLDVLMVEMRALASAEDVEGYLVNNTAFHDLIYRMSGNERVRVLARQLILPIYQIRLPQRGSLSSLRLSYNEHESIAAALFAGDGVAAENRMRLHIANAGKGLRETLAALEPPRRPSRNRARA